MTTEKDALSLDVGTRLKELRESRHISMRELARRSDLSANALSMIERNLTSPSVSTLNKLAMALEIPITAFFRNNPEKHNVVFCKATERTRVPFMKGLWEGLGGESFMGKMEAFMLTLETGGSSGPHGMLHNRHEFVYCNAIIVISGHEDNENPSEFHLASAKILGKLKKISDSK